MAMFLLGFVVSFGSLLAVTVLNIGNVWKLTKNTDAQMTTYRKAERNLTFNSIYLCGFMILYVWSLF